MPLNKNIRTSLILLTFLIITIYSINGDSRHIDDNYSLFVNCVRDFKNTDIVNVELKISEIDAKAKLDDFHIGFNPSYLGSKNPPGDFSNNKFTRMLNDEFKIDVMRFPPGTYANFYNWTTFSLDDESVMNIGKESMVNSLKYQKKLTGGPAWSNFNSFMRTSLDRNIEPFIILNMYTQSVDEIIKDIKSIKKMWPSVKYWELGNELSGYDYNYKYTGSLHWDESVYVKKAKKITNFIKKNYPLNVVGVVGTDLYKERFVKANSNKVRKLGVRWGNALKKINNFDALIYHPYVFLFADDWWDDKNLLSIKNVCKTKSPSILRSAARLKWVFASAQELPELYNKKNTDMYPGKSLWITEVGLIGHGANDIVDWKYGFVRSLFNMSMFLHWFEKAPTLEVYMFHLLAYGKSEFSAYYKDFSFNSNSITYAFINNIFRKGSVINKLEIINAPHYKGVGIYENISVDSIIGVSANVDGVNSILLVNVGGGAVKVKIPWKGSKIIYANHKLDKMIKQGVYHSFEDLPAVFVTDDSWHMQEFSIALIIEKL